MRHHTRAFAAIAATVLAASVAAGCSSGGTTQSSPETAGASTGAGGTQVPAAVGDLPGEAATPAPGTVTTKSVRLGKILVDDKGKTLYVFERDTTSTSTCTGTCPATWPPLVTTTKPMAAGGVQSKLLSTSKRPGGGTQVTYNGHPLYRFSGDKKSGDTNGQGLTAFGAKWFVIGTDGKKITTTPPRTASPTGSATKTSGGGY